MKITLRPSLLMNLMALLSLIVSIFGQFHLQQTIQQKIILLHIDYEHNINEVYRFAIDIKLNTSNQNINGLYNFELNRTIPNRYYLFYDYELLMSFDLIYFLIRS